MVPSNELCGASTNANPPFTVYCTRPAGHDGEHIAAIGPWEPGAPILTTWPQDVVVDDDGDVIELPPAKQDRAHELRLRDAEREARHAQRITVRAQRVLGSLPKIKVRELQDAEVLREFLRLLQQVDGTDYRKGHGHYEERPNTRNLS